MLDGVLVWPQEEAPEHPNSKVLVDNQVANTIRDDGLTMICTSRDLSGDSRLCALWVSVAGVKCASVVTFSHCETNLERL